MFVEAILGIRHQCWKETDGVHNVCLDGEVFAQYDLDYAEGAELAFKGLRYELGLR